MLAIIEFYYQNACSVKKIHRALLPFHGQFNRLTEVAIQATVTKFRTKFTVLDIKPPTRLPRVRTEETDIELYRPVLMMTLNYRFVAVRSNWASDSTTWKILRKNLEVKPFKIQLVQELMPNDLTQRRMFGEWALGKLAEDPLFYRKIVFSEEAHFCLNGYVTKKNCGVKISQKNCKSY